MFYSVGQYHSTDESWFRQHNMDEIINARVIDCDTNIDDMSIVHEISLFQLVQTSQKNRGSKRKVILMSYIALSTAGTKFMLWWCGGTVGGTTHLLCFIQCDPSCTDSVINYEPCIVTEVRVHCATSTGVQHDTDWRLAALIIDHNLGYRHWEEYALS